MVKSCKKSWEQTSKRSHGHSLMLQARSKRNGSTDLGKTPVANLFAGGVEDLLDELGHQMETPGRTSPPLPSVATPAAPSITPGRYLYHSFAWALSSCTEHCVSWMINFQQAPRSLQTPSESWDRPPQTSLRVRALPSQDRTNSSRVQEEQKLVVDVQVTLSTATEMGPLPLQPPSDLSIAL